METDIDTYTQTQAFALPHTCTLTNEHSYSHSHTPANAHIQQTSHHFSSFRPQMSELSLVFYNKSKKKKVFDLNGIVVIFLVYLFPKIGKKINYI